MDNPENSKIRQAGVRSATPVNEAPLEERRKRLITPGVIKTFILWAAIVILVILCAGDPDLLGALIYWLTDGALTP